MACGNFAPLSDNLKAVIVIPNYVAKTVDSTGSKGLFIRLVIKRNGVTIQATIPELNTGINQIAYTEELSNGDQLIVQVSQGDRFYSGEYLEDAKWIPKSNLAFAPV